MQSADVRSARLAKTDIWSRIALATAIAGSALALGTVHTVTLCFVTTALAAAAVLAWWNNSSSRIRSSATLLFLCAVGHVAYTAFQCLPLPSRVLAAVAPHNGDVWSRALMPLHAPGPQWAPITLDPIATHIELLKGVAYLLAYLAALSVAHRRSGTSFLTAVIVLTGVAIATSALVHSIVGATRVFGVYKPMEVYSG